jgi:hypothetical protein
MAKTHISGPLQIGSAYMPQANTDGFRGAPASHLYVYELVAPLTASGTAIFATTAVATGAGVNLFGTSTAAFATNGIVSTSGVTLDFARCITITSTGALAGSTFSLSGTSYWGETMTETLTGPTGNTVTTQKAFKTITSMAYNATSATGVPFSVGLSASFGLPYHASRSSKITSITVDGEPHTSTGTVFTAPLTATGTSTATTADTRGLINIVSEAPNASINYAITQLVDPTSSNSLYGADQA